jgi:uncharacterized protein DUF2154
MTGKWAVAAAAAFSCASCVVDRTGPTQHEYRAIDRDNAELVRVDLTMGAGTLRVDSGTDKLAAADFTFNRVSWKPEVRYRNYGGHGTLSIGQPETHSHRFGSMRNDWDIRLNREVPLEIAAHLGAGEAHMDLSGLTVRDVDIEMGVGQLDLDLRGAPKKSYDVRIQGGVGEATVRVPSNVGVEAEARGGIGEVHASGLRQDGHRYYNDALADSKVVIHLDIEGGVGSIRLISD